MCCLQVQAVIEVRESPSTFLISDVVKIIGYGVGEEGKLVAHGNVMNVQGIQDDEKLVPNSHLGPRLAPKLYHLGHHMG